MEEMRSEYSINQKGAVVTVTFAAVWALLSMIIAINMELQSTFALVIFAVLTLIAWILVPLYFTRMKSAYFLGVVLLVFGLVGLFASPGDPPWYTFIVPISIVKELSFVIDSLFGIFLASNLLAKSSEYLFASLDLGLALKFTPSSLSFSVVFSYGFFLR